MPPTQTNPLPTQPRWPTSTHTVAPAARHRRGHHKEPPLKIPKTNQTRLPLENEPHARSRPAPLPHGRTSGTSTPVTKPPNHTDYRPSQIRMARIGQHLELSSEVKAMAADRPPGQIWPRTDPGQIRRHAAVFTSRPTRWRPNSRAPVGRQQHKDHDLQSCHEAQRGARIGVIGEGGEERRCVDGG
jgi:hypothetical protein